MPISERGMMRFGTLCRGRGRMVGRPLLAALALCPLLACTTPQGGGAGVDAAADPAADPAKVVLVSASPELVQISARGRSVSVVPTTGDCIAKNSLEIGEHSAFVLMTDCAVETDKGAAPAITASSARPSGGAFPGLITVSVGGEPRVALPKLSAFLRSAEGRAQLGRGLPGENVVVQEMKQAGGVLYVLVRDRNPPKGSILSDAFWRAFDEINDRMVLVTVSCFRAHAPGTAAMFEAARAQVAALHAANGGTPVAGLPARAPVPAQEAAAAAGAAPSATPEPRRRTGAGAGRAVGAHRAATGRTASRHDPTKGRSHKPRPAEQVASGTARHAPDHAARSPHKAVAKPAASSDSPLPPPRRG